MKASPNRAPAEKLTSISTARLSLSSLIEITASPMREITLMRITLASASIHGCEASNDTDREEG